MALAGRAQAFINICTSDANSCLRHEEAHGAHSGHLLTAAMVTGKVTAVLPTGSVGFWASGSLLSILAGADIGSNADATPTAKGAEGQGTVPTAHGGRPARAAAAPKPRQADVGAQSASLRREVAGWLSPSVASGHGPQQQERNAGGPEKQSGPHNR